jgi:hemerythrin-like metal-binding protein
MKSPSSHKLGHPEIDKEHEWVFRQLEQLSSLISNRTEDETILKLLDKAIETSVAHNFNEEHLMSKLENYDELSPHILEHRMTVKDLIEFRNNLQKSIIDSQLEFKRVLRKWQDHLFKYDKKFVETLLNDTRDEKEDIE